MRRKIRKTARSHPAVCHTTDTPSWQAPAAEAPVQRDAVEAEEERRPPDAAVGAEPVQAVEAPSEEAPALAAPSRERAPT